LCDAMQGKNKRGMCWKKKRSWKKHGLARHTRHTPASAQAPSAWTCVPAGQSQP
jgi:hypothetical protein